MIKNIGTQFELIENFLSANTTINNLFTGGIYAGKPISISDSLSLYFGLSNNTPIVQNDREGQNIIKKRAILEFILTTNKKDTPDVEIYEALDILSNELSGKSLNLSGFIINSIQEGNQSGVIMDTNQNPLLIAEFTFIYQNKY